MIRPTWSLGYETTDLLRNGVAAGRWAGALFRAGDRRNDADTTESTGCIALYAGNHDFFRANENKAEDPCNFRRGH
jgi:hypothetical protein